MTNDILARLNSVLGDGVQDRHSLFQLNHFVLGKELTAQGKMWQCLREMQARRDSIEALRIEKVDAEDKIELIRIHKRELERRLASLPKLLVGESDGDDIDRLNALHIQIRQQDRLIESRRKAVSELARKIGNLEVEAAFFIEEFERINAETPVKPIDDPEAQKEYWTAKIFQEVQLKSLLGLPLETELVKTVLSLNDDSPVKAQMIAFLGALKDARMAKAVEPK